MILKLLRIKKGLRQEDLARKLGVTQQYISTLENENIDNLTLGNLHKLSKVLEIDEIELHKLLIRDRN